MIPVVFINCRSVPYLDMIIDGQKTIETRTRDTLRNMVGRRVLLAETGNGKPVVRCSAVIRSARPIYDRKIWNSLRRKHRVPEGGQHDWKPETKVKYCYDIVGVVACWPFTPPEDVRHGRVWMEYNNEERR